MPKGPKGKKRPRDISQRAKLIVDIATGQAEEKDPDEGKNPAAVALGKAPSNPSQSGLLDASNETGLPIQ